MITKAKAAEIKAVKFKCKQSGWLRKKWLCWWLPDATVRAMIGILSNTIYVDGVSADDFTNLPVWTKLLMHEKTHLWQRRRYGWIKFYATYLCDWLAGIAEGLSPYLAYRAVRYETEAREAEKYAIL